MSEPADVKDPAGHDDSASWLERYPPPYRLWSDMLFAATFVPVAPVRAAFPSVTFRSVGGRAVLATWFACVRMIRYGDGTDEVGTLGGPDELLYYELNIAILLEGQALFVPDIYATSRRTIGIGHQYGMPKQSTSLRIETHYSHFRADMEEQDCSTTVRARRRDVGGWLARVASSWFPFWSWPAYFPDGRSVQARLLKVPTMQVAWLQKGVLSLPTDWLPEPVDLWRLGLYAPNTVMELPPPDNAER